MTVNDLLKTAICDAVIIRDMNLTPIRTSKFEERYTDFNLVLDKYANRTVLTIKPCYSTELLIEIN